MRGRDEPKALITDITGQDGSTQRNSFWPKAMKCMDLSGGPSTFNTSRKDDLYQDPHDLEARLFLHYGDLSDSGPAQPFDL